MSNFILVDTDILIDVGRGVEKAVKFIQSFGDLLTVSVVTEMELVVGCRNKRELKSLEQFLGHFLVLPVNEAVCEKALGFLKQYRLSHGLLIADAFIAATAVVFGYQLATRNRKHYRFIPELKLFPYL